MWMNKHGKLQSHKLFKSTNDRKQVFYSLQYMFLFTEKNGRQLYKNQMTINFLKFFLFFFSTTNSVNYSHIFSLLIPILHQ